MRLKVRGFFPFTFYRDLSLTIFVVELLKDPKVLKRMSDTKAMREMKALETFFERVRCDPDKALFGLKHVTQAAEVKAIEVLLISDHLFK